GGALEVPAALGAVVALAAVLSISRRQGAVDPVTLVLSGVIVGTVCAAASTVIESLLPPDRRGSLVAWAFGRIPEVPDPAVLWTCVSATAAFLALTAWLGPRLDAATLSDDEARSVGVSLGALRRSPRIRRNWCRWRGTSARSSTCRSSASRSWPASCRRAAGRRGHRPGRRRARGSRRGSRASVCGA
ncbi:MAG: iron chelate uptake ABC transporter family permease subunit, partial [Phycisphaerales bacterium]